MYLLHFADSRSEACCLKCRLIPDEINSYAGRLSHLFLEIYFWNRFEIQPTVSSPVVRVCFCYKIVTNAVRYVSSTRVARESESSPVFLLVMCIHYILSIYPNRDDHFSLLEDQRVTNDADVKMKRHRHAYLCCAAWRNDISLTLLLLIAKPEHNRSTRSVFEQTYRNAVSIQSVTVIVVARFFVPCSVFFVLLYAL